MFFVFRLLKQNESVSNTVRSRFLAIAAAEAATIGCKQYKPSFIPTTRRCCRTEEKRSVNKFNRVTEDESEKKTKRETRAIIVSLRSERGHKELVGWLVGNTNSSERRSERALFPFVSWPGSVCLPEVNKQVIVSGDGRRNVTFVRVASIENY